MDEPTTYEIVLRGRPGRRLLRPLLDDFTIDVSPPDGATPATRLVGVVGDPAHLHGIVTHLTSVNVGIVSIAPVAPSRTETSIGGSAATLQDPPTSIPGTAATPEPMRAITHDRYGSADVLELTHVGRPEPAADEVLVEVVAAGIDRGTCHLMTGTPYLIRLVGYGLTRPKDRIPGLDVAGRVVAVGTAVTRFAPGDEVLGIAHGALAEYATAEEGELVAKPAGLSFEQAAVVAVSGSTALQALTDVGGVRPGQRVLIVGASGGVGSFAVQLADALGADVTAVASTRNVDLVRSLGADHVVDRTIRDFTEIDEPFDLIVDVGGRNSIRRLRSVLAPTGTLVIVGGEGGNHLTGGVGRQLRAMALSPFVRQRLTTFISTVDRRVLERLVGHVESGAVTPAVGATFDLADAPRAIDRLSRGRASGKTAIVVRDRSDDGPDRPPRPCLEPNPDPRRSDR